MALIWFSCFCCASENLRLMPDSLAALLMDSEFAVRHSLSAPICAKPRVIGLSAAGAGREKSAVRLADSSAAMAVLLVMTILAPLAFSGSGSALSSSGTVAESSPEQEILLSALIHAALALTRTALFGSRRTHNTQRRNRRKKQRD